MSSDELDRIIPVNPPIVNMNRNPIDHHIGRSNHVFELDIVAIHLKILIPVGIAMIIVADVKYARESMSIPTVNIWCPHTMNPRNPIVNIA